MHSYGLFWQLRASREVKYGELARSLLSSAPDHPPARHHWLLGGKNPFQERAARGSTYAHISQHFALIVQKDRAVGVDSASSRAHAQGPQGPRGRSRVFSSPNLGRDNRGMAPSCVSVADGGSWAFLTNFLGRSHPQARLTILGPVVAFVATS